MGQCAHALSFRVDARAKQQRLGASVEQAEMVTLLPIKLCDLSQGHLVHVAEKAGVDLLAPQPEPYAAFSPAVAVRLELQYDIVRTGNDGEEVAVDAQ